MVNVVPIVIISFDTMILIINSIIIFIIAIIINIISGEAPSP